MVHYAQSSGFTLIEGLIVVIVIALLAMMGVPSFMGFLEQRKINTSQHLLYQALRATQIDAMQERHDRQFSLRERDGRVEWASHPVSIAPAQVGLWTPLVDGVKLAEEDNTLAQTGDTYYVRFTFKETYSMGWVL
ncbi:MAG: prepilin-type N-terminal cleavage/methylation domain-containing protein [Leptolyngbyaceae cyanobacterium SM2_3_12]|nr:prepilin-type N-terminal cleavage/methylation domain-containing protein [Leptolyngbyaceae cyanobacterium SM2_3_12]